MALHAFRFTVPHRRRALFTALFCLTLTGCGGGGSGTGDLSAGDDENGAGTNPASAPGSVAAPSLRTTLAASWDENWFASPVVFDLDDDGEPEIIAARHGVLYVWRNTGSLWWRAPVGESASSSTSHGAYRQYASPVVGDLDDDGEGEIAIAYSYKVAVYEHNGVLKSGWPQNYPNGSTNEIRSLAAADLNGDDRLEILAVKTGTGPVTTAWNLNGTVVSGWPQANCADCYDYGGYNQNIGAADLTGDGVPEVVSTYDRSRIGIMSANGAPLPANAIFSSGDADQPWVSSVPLFHDLALAIQGWGNDGEDRDQFTDSPPAFGDIDGDGELEVVIYSDHEVAGEETIIGNCLWVLNPDLTRPDGFETPLCSDEPLYTGYEDNIVQVAPSPALGDLADDSRPEMVVPSYDGRLYAYTPDGERLWFYRFDSAGGSFIGASGAAIGDLNHDGSAEVVFNTYSPTENVSNLIVLNAAGVELRRIALEGRGSMSVPTLADVDGDGDLEILVSLKDTLSSSVGGVQIWDVAGATVGYLPWPTGRGNDLRTGEGR